MPDSSLCDLAILEELRGVMGGQFPALIDLYLHDTQERLGLVRALSGVSNLDQRRAARRAVHSIRAASAHLGALRMADVAGVAEALLEDETRPLDAAVLLPLSAQLGDIYVETARILQPFRGAAD